VIFTDVDSEEICRVEMMNVFAKMFFDCSSNIHYEEIVHQKLFKPVESGSTKSLKELIMNAIKSDQMIGENGESLENQDKKPSLDSIYYYLGKTQ
jgi:hypothetical protein